VADGFAPFPVRADGLSLAARSYQPDRDRFPGNAVILLHGIFSSADMFDVRGLEAISLARRLQRDGIHVITYDQRGGGDSSVTSWKFGIREHALVDLPAVIVEANRRFGLERIVLGGHSLGGMIWLRWMQANGTAGGPLPLVVGAVAIASPAFFDQAFPPWSDFADRGRSFVESIDANSDRIIDRAEFTRGQALLYRPWMRPLLSPAMVERSIRLGAKAPWAAGLVRRLPIPSLIYNGDDFDSRTFMYLLRSRAIDRGSNQLLLELFDAIGSMPGPSDPVPLDVLCIGSAADHLVPLRTVEGLASLFRKAHVVSTERDYGSPTGHAGYFFKASVRDGVYADVKRYVETVLGR
jgi:pimeloyl-ACP methyl ester carboxylesterase